MLIWRNGHAKIFGYRNTRTVRGGTHQTWTGVALKAMGHAWNRPAWRHFQVEVISPVVARGRGCWTLEASTWRTAPDERTRATIKAFVRVKIGLGGTWTPVPSPPKEDPAVDLARRKRKLTRDMAEVKEIDRVLRKAGRRKYAQQQKGPSVRRGLGGKPLPNSRRPERPR